MNLLVGVGYFAILASYNELEITQCHVAGSRG